MSRIACYLLACTMILTTITGTDPRPPLQPLTISQQCINRGPYLGACLMQNIFTHNWKLTCWALWCAFRQDDGSDIATFTGAMDDGTHCGEDKVCEAGSCVPKDERDIVYPSEVTVGIDCESPVNW